MSSKQRVLFVDDEPNVLEGLRRMLRPMRREWEIAFAGSGDQALAMLAQWPFDVVVSDIQMPGMNGVELLGRVRREYPNIVCMALSGESAKESVLDFVGPIHQYLPKPFDADSLKFALSRIGALRRLLSVEKLRTTVAKLEKLPSLPALFRDLMKQFESPDGSIKKVGQIVSRDISMSAKVIQLVNSAFFGVRKPLTSPQAAVAALGMETVKTLALTVCVFSQFEEGVVRRFLLRALWDHSMASGTLAQRILNYEGDKKRGGTVLRADVIQNAFTASLLHDIGKLVFASMLPDDYSVALVHSAQNRIGIDEAEQEVIGASHGEVGAYLLGLWGFADPVIEAVAYHHNPMDSPRDEVSTLTVVHIADALACDLHPTPRVHSHSEIDQAYIDRLGLTSRLATWTELCRNSVLEEISP
ncbi:MAG: HDOD domain-containing protein [Phycisphaerae bacterium]|nr:HDOD domain-containing protein [Phycisphaerae bacterium]